MRTLAEIERSLDTVEEHGDPATGAAALLALSEEILEHWIAAKGDEPTEDRREGFRLLALHRQGSRGDPSFNACRETCREVAWHYNLLTMQPGSAETTNRLAMMKLVSKHLFLFVTGKLQVAQLGEFCCSSKPIRLAAETVKTIKEA